MSETRSLLRDHSLLFSSRREKSTTTVSEVVSERVRLVIDNKKREREEEGLETRAHEMENQSIELHDGADRMSFPAAHTEEF